MCYCQMADALGPPEILTADKTVETTLKNVAIHVEDNQYTYRHLRMFVENLHKFFPSPVTVYVKDWHELE